MLRLVEILAAAFGPDSGDAPFRALAHRLLSLFPAETGSYASAPFRFTSERYLLPLVEEVRLLYYSSVVSH